MNRPPRTSQRPDPLFPYTTLFRRMRGKLAHWRRRQTARLLPTNSTIERDDGDYRAQQNGKAPHLRAFQEQRGGYVIEAEILRSRFGYRARTLLARAGLAVDDLAALCGLTKTRTERILDGKYVPLTISDRRSEAQKSE